MPSTIKITRAPVLTLWAAVVAERLGYDRAAALTLGKAVGGYAAYSKGEILGLGDESRESPAERRKREKTKRATTDLMGRRIPIEHTADGVRALDATWKPIEPRSVDEYLAGKFGAALEDVRAAMVVLAHSMTPAELRARAFGLYGVFRPEIRAAIKGSGVAFELDVELIKTAGLEPRAA